jgi:hypothetical protein
LQRFDITVSGEYGGLYLWESKEALMNYRASDLRSSIAAAYKTDGEPSVQILEVFESLRDTMI